MTDVRGSAEHSAACTVVQRDRFGEAVMVWGGRSMEIPRPPAAPTCSASCRESMQVEDEGRDTTDRPPRSPDPTEHLRDVMLLAYIRPG